MLSSRIRGAPAPSASSTSSSVAALDLERQPGRVRARPAHRLAHAAGDRRVVLLDQDRVVEAGAVVGAAAGGDGRLLERAQPGRRLARVEDPRAGALDRLGRSAPSASRRPTAAAGSSAPSARRSGSPARSPRSAAPARRSRQTPSSTSRSSSIAGSSARNVSSAGSSPNTTPGRLLGDQRRARARPRGPSPRRHVAVADVLGERAGDDVGKRVGAHRGERYRAWRRRPELSDPPLIGAPVKEILDTWSHQVGGLPAAASNRWGFYERAKRVSRCGMRGRRCVRGSIGRERTDEDGHRRAAAVSQGNGGQGAGREVPEEVQPGDDALLHAEDDDQRRRHGLVPDQRVPHDRPAGEQWRGPAADHAEREGEGRQGRGRQAVLVQRAGQSWDQSRVVQTERPTTYDGTTRIDSGLPAGNGRPKPLNAVFTKAGTYRYFCDVHPFMTGEVVVKSKGQSIRRRPGRHCAQESGLERSAAIKTAATPKVPKNHVRVGGTTGNGAECSTSSRRR